jgi:hypothetical protein
MLRLEKARETVKRIIREVAAYPTSDPGVVAETVFDDEHGHYMLFYTGWDRRRRIHGSVIHIDLRDDKVWVQHDGTNLGIVGELIEAGIPQEEIVLGFHHPDQRHHTPFAVA